MGNNTTSKRIFGFDALKALAAFLVVLYHVGMVDLGYRAGEYYFPTVTQLLWLFTAAGVPLFFMVNGALTIGRRYDLKKSLTKAGRLVGLGALWGIVVMALLAARSHDLSCFTPGGILRAIPYYWFLFSLALMYVATYVLNRLPNWCTWAVICLLLICPFATNLSWDIVRLINPGMHFPAWDHIGVFTMYGLVYMYAGHHLADKRPKWWTNLIFALAGLALIALECIAVVNAEGAQFEGGNYCFPTLGALLLSVGIFGWGRHWSSSNNAVRAVVAFLGNNALGIYIFHLILMIVVGWAFPHPNLQVHPVVAVLIAVGYTFASALISELIRRSPLRFLLKL